MKVLCRWKHTEGFCSCSGLTASRLPARSSVNFGFAGVIFARFGDTEISTSWAADRADDQMKGDDAF
jgi:hypothetical protein